MSAIKESAWLLSRVEASIKVQPLLKLLVTVHLFRNESILVCIQG